MIQGNRGDVEERVGNMKREERGVTQIEASKENREDITANQNIQDQKQCEYLLNVQPITPLLAKLDGRDIKELGTTFRTLLLDRCHLLHFTRVHIHRVRKYQIEPFNELVDGVTLLMILVSEDVDRILLQCVPLNLHQIHIPTIQSNADNHDHCLHCLGRSGH